MSNIQLLEKLNMKFVSCCFSNSMKYITNIYVRCSRGRRHSEVFENCGIARCKQKVSQADKQARNSMCYYIKNFLIECELIMYF